MKKGILLVNIGTPDAPTPEKVGAYLKEFLMDPLVIDLPLPLRWFLVHMMIVPKRSYASAEAYQKIWTEQGSPLKFYSESLARQLEEHFAGKSAEDIKVQFAMRYQRPSIASVLEKWRDFDEIVVVPMYPQYSLSATESSIKECRRQAKRIGLKAQLKFVPPYFRDPYFISAFSQLLQKQVSGADHILFSFHGLPSRQIRKMDETKSYCLKRGDCCAQINTNNENHCYRAQSFETARGLAESVDWLSEKYTVSFQSRLNSGWIRPYTDEVIPRLARHGVKNLVVICPSFTTDCLETIEEMGIRGRDLFLESGGEEFRLVSCLNAEPIWVEALSRIIQKV